MSRIGKCKEKGCNGEIMLGGFSDWRKNCDGIGFCRKCFTEYKLEYKGRSNYLTI